MFEGVVVVLLGIMAVTAASLLSDQTKKIVASRRTRWRLAARHLDLHYDEGDSEAGNGRLRGTVQGRRVQVDHEQGSQDGAQYTRVTIALDDAFPEDVRLGTEGLGSGVANLLGRGDFDLGDARFDRRFLLHGDPVHLAAVFGSRARRALFEEGTDPVIANGKLTLRRAERLDKTREVVALVKRAVAVAAMLDKFDDLPARLLSNARSDDDREVRLTCGRLVAERYPDHPQARDLGARFVRLPGRAPRLLGMHLLGPDDARARDIAASVAFEEADATAAEIAEALEWLEEAPPRGEHRGGIRGRVQHADVAVQLAALACLGASGTRDDIELLWSMQDRKAPVGPAAAEAAERIRARLGLGGDAGRLSVSAAPPDEAEGRLSQAAPEGALAFEGEPPTSKSSS